MRTVWEGRHEHHDSHKIFCTSYKATGKANCEFANREFDRFLSIGPKAPKRIWLNIAQIRESWYKERRPYSGVGGKSYQ